MRYIVKNKKYQEAIELLKRNEDIKKEISILQDEINNLKKILNDKIKERNKKEISILQDAIDNLKKILNNKIEERYKTELYLGTKQTDKNYQTLIDAIKSNRYWYNEVTNEIIRVDDLSLGIKFTDFIKGEKPHQYSSSAKRILTSCPIPITEEYFNELIESGDYE